MFEWFKRKPQNEKESRTGQVMFTGRRDAQWHLGSDKTSAKDYAHEGYQKNVIAYQAINKRADAVAGMKWIVRAPNGDEIENHPLLRLIERPNPMQSGSEFMRALVGFYSISGNSYLERVMVGQQPRELYALRPDRMSIKPSPTGMPSGYRFQVGQAFVDFEADPRSGASDIRHLKTFNPLDDWYGMSPLMAGAYAVDQHNEAMTWVQALLQNGASPSGVLELPEGTNLTDDQFNRLKSEIDEKYAGGSNAGRAMLLEGGLKWTQIGLSPVDAAIIETKYSAARDVSLALGVPPLLLNIPGDSTYNNYKEARLAFYEETAIPLAHYIRDELNAWLSPLFGGAELDIDLDQIPAIAEKRMELWTMADQATDLTINEKRAMKGYEEIDGGDQILVQSSLIPLGLATDSLGMIDGGEGAGEQIDIGQQGSTGKVQDLALNGAQITSVAQIVQSVADGMLPPESAITLLMVAFPAIDEATARAIINPAASFESPTMAQVERHILTALVMKRNDGKVTAEDMKALAYGPKKTS